MLTLILRCLQNNVKFKQSSFWLKDEDDNGIRLSVGRFRWSRADAGASKFFAKQ